MLITSSPHLLLLKVMESFLISLDTISDAALVKAVGDNPRLAEQCGFITPALNLSPGHQAAKVSWCR
jgi:hypothetical protein